MGDQIENSEKEGKPSQELLEPTPEVLEPIFRHCARIYKIIDKMSREELTKKLEYYGLVTNGNHAERKRRLKNYYRRFKLSNVDIDIKETAYPYYVIVDFEATCLETNDRDYHHEIIEFPAVLVNSETLNVEDTFQMYCKPEINPKLSEFCTKLTGITQEQVDSAESFKTVFEHFEKWLRKHKLMRKDAFAIVADTPWDVSRFLYSQCVYSQVEFPKWAKSWVDIKYALSYFYKVKPRPLTKMLAFFNMEFEGRLHCGLDDAKNIARVMIRMIRDGANFRVNESIIIPNRRHKPKKEGDEDKEGTVKPVRATFRGSDPPPIRKNTHLRMLSERDKIEKQLQREIMENITVEEDDSPVEWVTMEQIKDYHVSFSCLAYDKTYLLINNPDSQLN